LTICQEDSQITNPTFLNIQCIFLSVVRVKRDEQLQIVIGMVQLPELGFMILCPDSEPGNCFALFYFVINACCISHVIKTLFSNPEIPGFGVS